ncbi:cucumber peeling cupredoxin-like [Quercus robur]|uniref:cucumber peeling cupredoxin-like n=1 Tax=Quercus robur TaxID=38942 RepID=UPI002161AC17|nr:cucumber peeling cupredoxin-like [Quercus robur]
MEKLMSVVIVLGVVAAVLLQCTTAQTVHVVGDNIGWTIPQGGAQAYQTWAASKQFVVGDILMFNFTTNEHDVLKVPKESYDACSNANPIGNTITTGPANVTLEAAGSHYYICTVGRHCLAGQKLAITVSSSPGATPPSTNTPTTPTTPTPTSTTPAACSPSPTPSPDKVEGPSTMASPPPPSSSSFGLFASFFVSLMSIAIAFLF